MQPDLEDPRSTPAFPCVTAFREASFDNHGNIGILWSAITTLKVDKVAPILLNPITDVNFRFWLLYLHKFPPILQLVTSDWQWQCITQLHNIVRAAALFPVSTLQACYLLQQSRWSKLNFVNHVLCRSNICWPRFDNESGNINWRYWCCCYCFSYTSSTLLSLSQVD
jgi:hypothetical protein